MKPTPLLDFWQKPENAGEPVAVFATTFALEPDFFERNCLARFLEVSSVDEDSGSVDDIVAVVELHELLQKVSVTVLADRSAPVQRTSLLWDLLGCHVREGLLHAKVAVLIWENATRVILGSANLTAAGYRRQIELGLAADLGDGCLFQAEVLSALADELDTYLRLVPGFTPEAPVFARANTTLALFRQRIAQQPKQGSSLRVSFAPTNEDAGPLDALQDVWSGTQPLIATHLSPFWDANDRTVLEAIRKRLTGRPADQRRQRVAVVADPRGRIAFQGAGLGNTVDVRALKPTDQDVRTLHAKCLLLEGEGWVAALVGSSNHTCAGLGLSTRRHREANVWLGASKDTKEGKELLSLIELGAKVPADATEVEAMDEDEVDLPNLPACFGLCRVAPGNLPESWTLHVEIDGSIEMRDDWTIWLAADDPPLLTSAEWRLMRRSDTVLELKQKALPTYVLVEWRGYKVPWAVIADDRQALPPLPALTKLDAGQLLDALAKGRTLSQALREALEKERAKAMRQNHGIDLNPLRRLEVRGSLLRRGRELASSLDAMQRRLERPVTTLETLRSRLASPLGPEFVAAKLVESIQTGGRSRGEAVFAIGEIALTVGRVAWSSVLKSVDDDAGLRLVRATLERLDALRQRIDPAPVDLMSYARRAIQESHACLTV